MNDTLPETSDFQEREKHYHLSSTELQFLHQRLDEILRRIRTLELWRAGMIGCGIALVTLMGSEAGQLLGELLLQVTGL